MTDLSRGVYSGQFAFPYVEPRRNAGRYDQEIFFSTHEWEPRLMLEQSDESAEEEPDEAGRLHGDSLWRPFHQSTEKRWATANQSA